MQSSPSRLAGALLFAILSSSVLAAQHRAPGGHVVHTMRLVATAYCDKGPTKSGVRAQTGVVAADPRVLPIGTVLRIVAPGRTYAGTYTVMDTGSAVKGRTVDIFMPSCSRAQSFGRKPVQVRVLYRPSQ